jgi:hypothetical protein
MRTIADYDTEMGHQEFTESCRMQLWVKASQLEALTNAVLDIDGVATEVNS